MRGAIRKHKNEISNIARIIVSPHHLRDIVRSINETKHIPKLHNKPLINSKNKGIKKQRFYGVDSERGREDFYLKDDEVEVGETNSNELGGMWKQKTGNNGLLTKVLRANVVLGSDNRTTTQEWVQKNPSPRPASSILLSLEKIEESNE
ncbi:hypothetical protein V6N13_050357 [Hibiscus sabdariffa]|uniref:Uncharacterized protein n=1 Tax=Hibiscus sabdariffa TaxID=183260 RepID=A0ABR2P4I9_9ROSI